MRRTFERCTKARLSFSGGPHAPVNMADSMEEMNEGGEKRRKWHSRNVRSTVLHYISYATFSQVLEVLRDFHRLFGSRNSPTTGILSAMFTGACGTPEKISLALVPHSNVLRMIVKLAVFSIHVIGVHLLSQSASESAIKKKAHKPLRNL